jgi:hypothetical protein
MVGRARRVRTRIDKEILFLELIYLRGIRHCCHEHAHAQCLIVNPINNYPEHILGAAIGANPGVHKPA